MMRKTEELIKEISNTINPELRHNETVSQIERVFARLKEVFGLSKNRFVGIDKVAVHIYSCLIAH